MKVEEELPRILVTKKNFFKFDINSLFFNQNKFVKYFDPLKLIRAEVAELTGLNNRMLMDYAPFNRETVMAMEAFLRDFQKPFCFVGNIIFSKVVNFFSLINFDTLFIKMRV